MNRFVGHPLSGPREEVLAVVELDRVPFGADDNPRLLEVLLDGRQAELLHEHMSVLASSWDRRTVCVPPASVCSVTAPAEVWLRTVSTSLAASGTITSPVSPVPEPEPHTLPGIAVPLWKSANWFASMPEMTNCTR